MTESMLELMEEASRFIYSRGRQSGDLSTSMQELISLCREVQPHPDWPLLAEIGFSSGSAELTAWLEATLRNSPPDPEIRGLWFGLFNPIDGESGDLIRDATADIYVGGSRVYAPGDADHEWASELDYQPEEGDAHSSVLGRVYSLAYGKADGLQNSAEYPLCLGFATFWMREVLNLRHVRTLVAGEIGRGVAVGFDSGDAIDFGLIRGSRAAGA